MIDICPASRKATTAKTCDACPWLGWTVPVGGRPAQPRCTHRDAKGEKYDGHRNPQRD